MKTRELIEEARINVLRDISTAVGRSRVDGALWTDATLALYLRDAEAKFAAQTLCLRDSQTPYITQIELQAGVASYPIHKSIKIIYGAAVGRTHLNRVPYASRFGGRGDINRGRIVVDPGACGLPLVFYTDHDSNHVGVYPTPGEDQDGKSLSMYVARLPKKPISMDRLEAEPEIPEDYHLDLVDWACWRALRNHDVEIDGGGEASSLLMAKASSHRNRFEAAVKECSREIKRMNAQQIQFGLHANWG